jgi:hypothetical protein
MSEPPVVSEQTQVLLMRRPSPKQRVESALGAIADSRLETLFASLIAGGVIGVLTLFLGRLVANVIGVRGLAAEAESIVAFVLATVLVFVLFDVARSRRERLMAYVQQVADLNHHVRNALQVIRFQAAISKDGEEAVARINEAITRIDQALKTMYPLIHEGPPPAQDQTIDVL